MGHGTLEDPYIVMYATLLFHHAVAHIEPMEKCGRNPHRHLGKWMRLVCDTGLEDEVDSLRSPDLLFGW